MKNFKTNAMLLSLGLLVSGSVMHAVQQPQGQPSKPHTQKTTKESAIITKIHQAFNNIQQSKPLSITGDWTKVANEAIAFIKAGANTFPKSDTLTVAAQEAQNFVNGLISHYNTAMNPQDAYNKIKESTEQLNTAASLGANTKYYRSEKQAAYRVFVELIILLKKVGQQLLKIKPSSAAAPAVSTAEENPKQYNPRQGAPVFRDWRIPTPN